MNAVEVQRPLVNALEQGSIPERVLVRGLTEWQGLYMSHAERVTLKLLVQCIKLFEQTNPLPRKVEDFKRLYITMNGEF